MIASLNRRLENVTGHGLLPQKAVPHGRGRIVATATDSNEAIDTPIRARRVRSPPNGAREAIRLRFSESSTEVGDSRRGPHNAVRTGEGHMFMVADSIANDPGSL